MYSHFRMHLINIVQFLFLLYACVVFPIYTILIVFLKIDIILHLYYIFYNICKKITACIINIIIIMALL